MKAFHLIVAGAVIFCLGTMSAAEPTDQKTAKKRNNSGPGASRSGSTRNQGKLMVGVDDAHAAKSGGDSHGRVLVGNHQGVWRSGKNNQKKVEKKKETSTTTTSAGGSQASGSAQPANTIQTGTSAGGSQSFGSAQPATTIQTTTSVGGSQSLGSPQPTIPLGGQTGAPAPNTNSQTLGGLLQINPSPTP